MASRGIAGLAGLIVLLGACASDKEKSASVTISGRVFVAGKATPLEDADVVLPDGSRTKSGELGAFSAKSKSGKSVVVEGAGYAPVSKPAPKGDGYLELYALPTDAKKMLQGSKGGEITSEKGAKVNVPANGLARNGKAVSEAEIEIAVLDPRKGNDLPALPGNFDARRGGKAGKVTAESPIYIGAKSDGKPLEVSRNMKLTASVPVYHPAVLPNGKLFHYNEDTQEWEIRGRAVRINSKDVNARYDLSAMDRLGWWMLGEFFDKLSCVRACVVDKDDKPAPFARAVATGVDHFMQLSAYAGEDGCFALSVRADSQVSLAVQAQAGFVPGRVLMTGSESIDAAEDPEDCEDLGKLELQPQEVQECPQGLEKCEDACIDLLSDAANCGGCGDVCDGTEGREQSCIAGACACPSGFTTCVGDDVVHCALQETDAENCGGCNIVCEDGQACVDGACEGDDPADGGMDAGIEDAGMLSCIADGAATTACVECARDACCATCTGDCPALLACAYERCTDPRDCAVAQLCSDLVTTEALESFRAFVACTGSSCQAACYPKPDPGMPDASMPDASMQQRVCQPPTLTTQQQCMGQAPVCLGGTFSAQCTVGSTATTYEWHVTGPAPDTCAVECRINGQATGKTCTYPRNTCTGTFTTDKAPCDAQCGFPTEVNPPNVALPEPVDGSPDAGPDPQTTPGNDTAGIVSCGGTQTAETPCNVGTTQLCCMSGQVTAACTSNTAPCATKALCDGPEDCTTGQKCCLIDEDASAQTLCAATCPGPVGEQKVFTVCHEKLDCSAGEDCKRDTLREFWGTCQPEIITTL